MHDQNEGSYEQTIGGRYALYGPIASGGMATVHFGRQLGSAGFARTVAIKRLRGEFLESHEFISTLLDEARLASRIRHPNVVATMDMVAGPDEVFLVMEYVVGESLSRLLQKLENRQERIGEKIATGLMCGVLYALHAAHEACDERGEPMGIVHRDVSPQNILVGVDGLARLLDFGIAKGKGRLQTTRAGQLKGKVGYMAPEQILGEEPDRRSDVYAASVVLWEVLTGRRLFPSHTGERGNFDLIPKILEAQIDPPSEVADVPRAFDGIVMRGLNRERDARYATARELAVALEDAVGVATHRQIGEWVERVALEELAVRARQLRALEAGSVVGDRFAAERIATDTVKRRRKKRLASLSEEDETTTLDEGREGLDALTETGTPLSGPATARRAPTPDTSLTVIDEPTHDESLKATRIGHTQAAAQAQAIAQAKGRQRQRDTTSTRVSDDEEALRSTDRWSRDGLYDEASEAATGVFDAHPARRSPSTSAAPFQPSSERDDAPTKSGPPDPPTDSEDACDPEDQIPTRPHSLSPFDPESSDDADAPKPSDLAPVASVPSPSWRPSLDSDLALPVNSNRGLVIALVLAAVVAAVAAVAKMVSS